MSSTLKFSRCRNALANGLKAFVIAVAFVSLGLSADAQLVHCYSFTSGDNDSVGTANDITNPLAPIGGSVQLEIVVDRDTIEIFGNNGLLYMPMPVSNVSGNSLISLTCTGGTATLNALTVSKLKSIWLKP